jgi:methylthioribose-1-phosphate isomerase
LPAETVDAMIGHIKTLAVRGAPMIGCAAALVLAQHACEHGGSDIARLAEHTKEARPTAVNLMFCCDAIAQVQTPSEQRDFSPANIVKIAISLMKREEEMCAKMARFGASLVKDGDNILTHCNTGSLATFGVGTALGVIREAHRSGKKIHVYVDETRPLLQGGRLTAYELSKEGIPYTIICDNMAASLMRDGKVQRVFVGADRIAMNGDFANKIGASLRRFPIPNL